MMNRALLYGILKNKSGAEISASGNPAVLEGTVEGRAVKDLKVFGWSKQDSTTGAQLLDLQESDIRKDSELTVTLGKDGTITVDGSPKAAYVQVVTKKIQLEPGIYYASGGKKEAGYVYSQMNIKRSDGTWSYLSGVPIYIDGTEQEIQYVIQTLNTGAAIENYTMYPMLNIGAKALPWEPYTGGQPSPSPDYPQDIESAENPMVALRGKNLFSGFVFGGISSGNSPIYSAPEGYVYIRSDYIPCKPGKHYVYNLPDEWRASRIAFFNSAKKCIGQIAGKQFFDTSENAAYFVFQISKKDTSNIYKADLDAVSKLVQVEQADACTEYEPYQEQQSLTIQTPNGLPAIQVSSGGNYIDPSGKRWVADYIDLARGKYVQRIGILDKNSDWYKPKGDINQYRCKLSNVSNAGTAMANILTFAKSSSNNPDKVSGEYVTIYNSMICAVTQHYDTLDAFLASDLVILYPLATPIEHDLTQEELEAYKALTTCTGTTIVENDQDCYMEVSSTTGDTLRAKKLALLLGE